MRAEALIAVEHDFERTYLSPVSSVDLGLSIILLRETFSSQHTDWRAHLKTVRNLRNPLPLLSVYFSMGNSHSSGGARFATTEGLPVAQSYQPCHIFGDSDLYGVGIRYGFYFQYIGAALAVMYGTHEDFYIWRSSFVTLVAATFIALCVNMTGENLIVLDWSIMLFASGRVPGVPTLSDPLRCRTRVQE